MKKVLLTAAAALALLAGAATPSLAGQVYGNYGQHGPAYGPPPAPVYGPHYGGRYAGPPPAYYRGGYDRRHCGGDRAAGTIIGGILGGIIGNNIAGGRHRGPETVAGVIIGGVAGNAIAGSNCRHHRYRDARYGYAPHDVYRGDAYGGHDPRYDDSYAPGPGYDDGYAPGYDDEYDDVPYEDRPYDGR